MNHFTHRIIRGLPLITVDPFLKQGCFAAYTTREGGVSPPPYDSLNLSFSPTRKDSRENVEKNWSIVLQALDCFPQQLIRTHQTHSNRIAYVNHPGQSFFPDIPSGVDGVVTDRHELMLTVVTADCQGLLFYDPKKKISAAIHSGWRGALADIGGKAVCKMAAMGSDPADILVAGGPSIGTCCFEVGEDVLSLFQEQWGSDALAYFSPGDAKG
ncbi:MAG TPA: hypothetical protein DCY75_03855, partial [Clostridiales bacterium]|nr:hypothetical protein [Clostridiales bacterium]